MNGEVRSSVLEVAHTGCHECHTVLVAAVDGVLQHAANMSMDHVWWTANGFQLHTVRFLTASSLCPLPLTFFYKHVQKLEVLT
jgi:hypothetical protein